MWKLSTTIKGVPAEPVAVLRVPSLPKNHHNRHAAPAKIQPKVKSRTGHHDPRRPHAPKPLKWQSVHNWHIPAGQISHKARVGHSIGQVRAELPDRVTSHPGDVLREEFLKPFGLSVNGLALALRVPANRVGAIVKGERSVTADTALRLGRFFGNSPEFWMSLQCMHDLTRVRREFGTVIQREVHPRGD